VEVLDLPESILRIGAGFFQSLGHLAKKAAERFYSIVVQDDDLRDGRVVDLRSGGEAHFAEKLFDCLLSGGSRHSGIEECEPWNKVIEVELLVFLRGSIRECGSTSG
jgi:hypothetical protein